MTDVGAGHDVTPELIVGLIFYVYVSSHRRNRAVEGLGDDGAGLFAGGDKGVALRNTGQEGGDVGGGDDFEEGVGGVVLQAADFGGGVVEGEAGVGTEGANQSFVKPLLAGHTEVRLVPKVNQPHDAPEVVDPVGVIKRHAPAVRLGREAPKEKNARVRGQEGLEGVALGGGVSGHGRRGRIGVRVRGSARWRSGGLCGAW